MEFSTTVFADRCREISCATLLCLALAGCGEQPSGEPVPVKPVELPVLNVESSENPGQPNASTVAPSAEAEQQAEEHFFKAAKLYGEGKMEAAVEEFSEAIRLMPQNAVTFHNRATCYEQLGRWDAAIRDYDEAIRLDPNYSKAYNSRGNAHAGRGERALAKSDYTRTLVIAPEQADAWYNRGNMQDDPSHAVADYTEAVRLDPNYAMAFHNRGARRIELNQAREAVEDFTTAIRLDPGYAKAWHNRAVVYEQLGEAEHAAEDRRRAQELDPTLP